jgi:hypothetical protein
MRSFSFANPPKLPGIYALRHTPSGHLYFGQATNLLRRFQEWKSSLINRTGIKAAKLLSFVESTSYADWEFLVVTSGTGLNLGELENKAIAALQARAPDKLLNSITPPTEKLLKVGSLPKSIITYEGNQISYAAAVEHLGCATTTLTKRLARFRKQGVSTVTLEELKALSEKYRV